MGFFKDWLDRRLAKEHAKLIEQCSEKTAGLISVMQVAHARTSDPGIEDSIFVMRTLETKLAQARMMHAMEGKLRPAIAESLMNELKVLNEAERVFHRAVKGG